MGNLVFDRISPQVLVCVATQTTLVNKMSTCVCLHVMLGDLIRIFGTGLHFGSGRKIKSLGFTLVCPCKTAS